MTDVRTPFVTAYVEPGPGRPERFELRGLVMALNVDAESNKAVTATLELDNDDLSLLDETALSNGNSMVISYGYGEARKPARRYRIRNITGWRTLRVECHGQEVLLDNKPKRRTFSGLTVSEAVERVLLDAGFAADQLAITPTTARLPAQYQAGKTDAQFVAAAAKRLGWVFYLDDEGTYHFEPRDMGQAPVLKLAFRSTKDGAWPISDMSLNASLTRRPGKVAAAGVDPDNKEEVTVEASNATEQDRETTAPFIGTFDDESGELIVGRTPVGSVGQSADAVVGAAVSTAEAEEAAKGGFTEAVQHGVKLALTLEVGTIALVPRTIVEIVGIGARLSGRYWVTKVSESISAGSYSQNAEVITEGFQRGRGGAGGGDPAALPGQLAAMVAAVSADTNASPGLLAEVSQLASQLTAGWEQDPSAVTSVADRATRLAQIAAQDGAADAAAALSSFAASCRGSRPQGSDETTGAVNEQPLDTAELKGEGSFDSDGQLVVTYR